MNRPTQTSATPADAAVLLREPAVNEAPRVVGRPSRPVVVDAVASALGRLAAASVDVPRAGADEAALRLARDEGWLAGREEGRAEALRESAHAGFEEGLRQGLVEGRGVGEAEGQRRHAAALEQAGERLRRLDELQAAWSAELGRQLAERVSAVEDDMIALCHGVICRILGDGLATRAGVAQSLRAAVEDWLRASEQKAKGEGTVILVHPADLDAMKGDEVLARWLVQQGMKGVEWQAQGDVRLGGCIVRASEGDFDARLETQLELLADHLRRARTAAAHG